MLNYGWFLLSPSLLAPHIYKYKIYIISLSGSFTNLLLEMLHVLFSWVASSKSWLLCLFLIMIQNCQSLHLALDCELSSPQKCWILVFWNQILVDIFCLLLSSDCLFFFGFLSWCNFLSGRRSKGTFNLVRLKHTHKLDLNQKALNTIMWFSLVVVSPSFLSSVLPSFVCPVLPLLVVKHDSVSQSQEM